MLALMLLATQAHAQACICSRNVALPTGVAVRPWEGTFTVEYAVNQSGGEGWSGFSTVDRGGNSMAAMAMPGHLVQTPSLTAALGLPASFSVEATLPWMDIRHLYPSEMPGDVDSSSLADTTVLVRWGRPSKDKRTFFGVGAGVSLPTGKVVVDTPVRAGKGAVGGIVNVQVLRKVSPLVGVGLSAGASPTIFEPVDRYRVGSSASVAAGVRFTPRENGRWMFSGYLIGQFRDKDREEALVYEHTGVLSAGVSLGASWNVWAKDLRSVTLLARGEVPLWQIVGDPWLAENWGATAGVNVVAF
ncbi:MAG: hypothetical protein V4850_23470 [Myxococcota bacterium]